MTESNGVPPAGPALTDAISAALVALYAEFYEHGRTTATTYINDNVVVCVLEDILSSSESRQVADGAGEDVIDGRIAFQEGAQDEFTRAIECLTGRRVTAFLSANQTSPGVACELFFLEAPPAAAA
ncbi:MAG TPA: Na-translocating system protein MpsC family protein [Solirubrobacterales bacterium]|nr:Na-translocating system protein MpsC family protein [Solirubrobacterales bacterium]